MNTGYHLLLKSIMDESWERFVQLFTSHKIMYRDLSMNEAMFQFHFANLIQTIGNDKVSQNETFEVNLETRWYPNCKNGKKSKKYKDIDITCYIYCGEEKKYSCAIELKFKRKRNKKGTFAKDRMFNIYRDLEYLEHEIGINGKNGQYQEIYSEGRFYFMTDNIDYVNRQVENTGKEIVPFGLKKDTCTASGKIVIDSKKELNLNKSYHINWVSYGEWHFLEIDVTK